MERFGEVIVQRISIPDMAKGHTVAKKLEWVEARVPNYEKMKRFYRNVLRLPLNFEEERKDFIQFKVGPSKTYLALLDTAKTGMTKANGFVPTFEVSNLDKFISQMKREKVRVGRRIAEGDHVRLVDFYDPNGNLCKPSNGNTKRTSRISTHFR